MFERPHLQTVKDRIEEPRKLILVILGPRQVGKSTIANQLLSKADLPSFHNRYFHPILN